ncbi:MAG: IS1380 family transposase [Lachnospiraceae bacterium]|nr:IS1380 family transposase [Lachnospiraceae bacterium]
MPEGYVVIDVDVSPFINEKCKKEGNGRTYKKKDGFAPIFAYIGQEGYLLGVEFRRGEQHCQKGTPDFLRMLIRTARQITDAPLLFRLDSGNDAAENVGIFMEECYRGNNVHFIFKRNDRGRVDYYAFLEEVRNVCPDVVIPREGKMVFTGQTFRDVTYKVPNPTPERPERQSKKTVGIRTIYQIAERTIDKHGQHLLPPSLEADIYYCNIGLPDSRIIELYHEHGTMEQYHSEIKTNMGCELLPSGKFAVNSMILHLVQIAYNVLRLIEQKSLSWWNTVKTKRPVQRRRLSTVIKNVICAPALIKTHARKVLADLGKSNIWAGNIMWLARTLAPMRATRL